MKTNELWQDLSLCGKFSAFNISMNDVLKSLFAAGVLFVLKISLQH